MTPAEQLAHWIRAAAPPRPDALTHLKLQKLAFYCYGGLLAFNLDGHVGDVTFQAWKHGPVSPDMYDRYRAWGAGPLPAAEEPPAFSAPVESTMRDVLNVYGRLTAWQLREESHTEAPWLSAFDGQPDREISKDAMRAHFSAKFCGPGVRFPERLFGGSSMLLDAIPVPSFPSLGAMSFAVSRILGAA